MTACLARGYTNSGTRVNAVAPGGTEASFLDAPAASGERERGRWREVVGRTKTASLMHCCGTVVERAAAILFCAPDAASYITGVIPPVAGRALG